MQQVYRILKNRAMIGKRFRVQQGYWIDTRSSLSGFEKREFRYFGEWEFNTKSEAEEFIKKNPIR